MAQRATLLLRTVGTISAAALLAAGLTACGDDDDGLPPPPASPPPADPTDNEETLDLTPEEQEAVDEARAHIDEFLRNYVAVSTADLPAPEEAEELFSDVERDADGLLPQELRREIVGMWGEGQVVEGDLTWEALSVQSVDLENEIEGIRVPEVTVLFCVDATDWVAIDAATRDPASEAGHREEWLFTASWHDDWGGLGLEGWRVVEREHSGRAC
ncbi:hypothetical protein JQS43_00535 [Natronosporangium hydrolyticum]|uniref:Nuclear transport factor 2 family protein n=1 Tax=Natronosporangium hydrolyticum TaxID=2811111 RepID=A0A895YM08_9ACTN|nr:hypothetical protein [Natronosporangium hydrolyticum]QSB14918.1 hypothetical protein JQS43_00535 [Natronosporangium hydrolyticum]